MQLADLGRLGAGEERLAEDARDSPGAAILPVSRSMSTKMMPSGALNVDVGVAGQGAGHERGPDRQRRLRAAQAERLVVVHADPDDRQQLGREADEPGVAQIVGRSRLAGGVEREAGRRAPAPVPSLSTLRIMLVTRKVVSGRATVRGAAVCSGRSLPLATSREIARSGRIVPPLGNTV